jgi:hypothetical protein
LRPTLKSLRCCILRDAPGLSPWGAPQDDVLFLSYKDIRHPEEAAAAAVSKDPAMTTSESAPPLPRPLWALGAVCVACGVIGWLFFVLLFRGEPVQDWMVFYTASRAYFDGYLPLLSDGAALTAAVNERFAGWLDLPLGPHPWVYPPTFLLLLLPFGVWPPALSLALFLASGFVLVVIAAALYAGPGEPRRLVLLSLLLCPAVPFNIMTGQNAFFTGAVLLAGFGLVGRAPLVAGALLGLMSVKPQLALLVPVALVAARQWRALGAAAASALILALLSLAVLGLGMWQEWAYLMTGADEAFRAWVNAGRLNGVSVFACASHLGAPPAIANLLQAIAAVLAAGMVYWAYRRGTGVLPLVLLFAATMLAAPHVSNSDGVLLALATALLIGARPRPLSSAFAAAVWISPLVNPPAIFRIGALTPFLILLLLGAVIAEIRRG